MTVEVLFKINVSRVASQWLAWIDDPNINPLIHWAGESAISAEHAVISLLQPYNELLNKNRFFLTEKTKENK